MQASTLLPRAGAALSLLMALGAANAQSAPPATTATVAPAPAATASSDQNVPAATARKQAAEISRGDPARWSREDLDTAAQMKSLRKETAAALQESLGNCRKLAQAERAACAKQARATYQEEMAGLKTRLTARQ